MPIEYQIDHLRRLVLAKGRGTLTDEDTFGYQREVWSRPDVAGYDELVDMSEVEGIALRSSDRVRDLAQLSAAMDAPAAAKLAIVAPEDIAFGLGRMYEAYRSLEGRSAKRVGVFRSLAEALAFLGAEGAGTGGPPRVREGGGPPTPFADSGRATRRFLRAARSAVKRLHQGILIGSTLLGSWLGMQAVHEFGHVLGAWLTGGRVARVVLHPLTISRTDLDENLSPLLVVWAGPVVGVLLPLALWGIAAALRLVGAFVLRFFAGFCLIANGAYLSVGSFDGVGDCGEMLRHGSALWHLWLFGAVTVPAGLWLWHRQGPQFGLGPAGRRVSPGVAYATLAGCAALLVLGFAVGGE